jgi:hypothetical protein
MGSIFGAGARRTSGTGVGSGVVAEREGSVVAVGRAGCWLETVAGVWFETGDEGEVSGRRNDVARKPPPRAAATIAASPP